MSKRPQLPARLEISFFHLDWSARPYYDDSVDFASPAIGLNHLTFGCTPKIAIGLNTLALWQLFSLCHWLGLNWKSQEMGILTEVEAIENDLEGKGHKRKSHHQTGFPISMPLKMHCRKYNHPFSQYIRIDFRFWIETNAPFQHHLSEGVKVSPTNTKLCPKINW